jgi:peptidoglycan/LPS O-acetylase OafA/YrhL
MQATLPRGDTRSTPRMAISTHSALNPVSRHESAPATGADRRLPVLDGVRALAIVMVVLAHCFIAIPYLRPACIILGDLGVSTFMVLSGYLITKVMLADEAKSGRLRLGRFYRRRALRIFPALYCFLAVALGLSFFHLIPREDGLTWTASVFYFRNYIGSGWDTGHLWSLALEEQFYLIWPMLFMLARRRRLHLIGLAVIALTLWRTVWIHQHGADYALIDHVDLRMDTFLIGAAFAITRWDWIRFTPPLVFLGCILPCYSLVVPYEIRTAVAAFFIGALISWLLVIPSTAAVFLSTPVMVWLGKISYSIYLWQQLFTGLHSRWWSPFAIAAFSIASFYFIERPALQWKDKLEGTR